ncbi:MAG: hypothetical protein GY859_20705, partial [Desulfobacterales bacterium]|nr:hypothetical protein [Desulfobacterales bacterium]
TDPDFYRAHVLEAVLPFWERHGVDHRNGGFITHLDRHGAPYGRPIKNAAMMARLVLSFAQGFEISGRPAHLEMAENGFRFLVEKMWDPVHGGWLRDVAPDGVVESSEKRLFDQSYVLIGLAEFFRVSGSEKAREYIDRTFELLERRAWDPVFSGYYDSCFSDWRVKSDAKTLCTHLDMLTAALLLHDAAGESR